MRTAWEKHVVLPALFVPQHIDWFWFVEAYKEVGATVRPCPPGFGPYMRCMVLGPFL